MTELTDNKPKKLVLSSSRLSLSKPLDSQSLVKNFVSTKSKTIVEVKKSQLTNHALSLNKLSPSSYRVGEFTTEEFNKRLNLLKKAAEEAKSKESDQAKISTLTRLAAINQAAITQPKPHGDDELIALNPAKESLIDGSTETKNNLSKLELPILKGLFDSEEDSLNTKKKLASSKIVPAKPKVEELRKLKKTDIIHMLDQDESMIPSKMRSLASVKRAREKERRKLEQQKQDKVYREVIIPETITVTDLASRMTERSADIVRELSKLGIIASGSQSIDADTAEIIVTAFGHTAKRIQESDIENILISDVDTADNLELRAPIVTVMGHVDHGKTSLLDSLKSTNIVAEEAGGITQHIGAYRVNLASGKAITFIDTPGHEAFTSMRTRGAQITDIVILVVAADDGIKPQTIEAISHAKAAGVPIIVAINKIDKPDANIDSVKKALLSHDLILEEFGGEVMSVSVSALKKLNLDKLEEAILLLAEMLELKANPNGPVAGVVLEARIDKNCGVATTVLVQRGTLKTGDLVVAGSCYGRIKQINNDQAIQVNSALPTVPVEIYGLNDAPQAGDKFNIVPSEKQAREITEYRRRLIKEQKILARPGMSVEDLFLKAAGKGGITELPIIIKGDAQGSIEAIIGSLLKLPDNEVKLKILHSAVGAITESDVALAQASKAIILGFNVRANANAAQVIDKDPVDIRYYSIIYNLIDDIVVAISGMLAPIIREQYIGSVEIRQVFNISKIGNIAGSYVTKGTIKRGAGVRLLRGSIVIYQGKLKTLKRFKEDVKEVREGFECGIALENHNDIKVKDIVEVFEIIEEKQQLL